MALAQVFTGFWQNHSVPGTWGWTLTLSTTSANKLLIFLGIYLGFVGATSGTSLPLPFTSCLLEHNLEMAFVTKFNSFYGTHHHLPQLNSLQVLHGTGGRLKRDHNLLYQSYSALSH